MNMETAFSYDDVLLVPAYSEVLPGETDVGCTLAGSIRLNIPIISAAMDTVTEEDMAIALALQGGAGVIHRNMDPKEQARQVGRVKRFLNWVIGDPVTVNVGISIGEVRSIMDRTGVSGLPVLRDGKLCGIITERDLKFNTRIEKLVEDVMTTDLVIEIGEPSEETAKSKFDQHRIEKLPVVDDQGKLTGLITVKDMEKNKNYPKAALDSSGSLVVGAAVGPLNWEERIPRLLDAGVDFVVLDTAHGASRDSLKALEAMKRAYLKLPMIGGNVADGDGARRLMEAGSDAVKVGMGPGSICTTRIVAGIGVPQFSAVCDVVAACDPEGIPVIADGGIKYSGDIAKAIGAGASTVMLGNLLAGLKEAPGREVIYEGRIFKTYRAMGSIGAIQAGSGDRYHMKENEEPNPEGIEGRVPYKGELAPYLRQLVAGLRKGMGYTGSATLEDLRKYRRFVRISAAGLRESHPHDVSITHEAPNYTRP